MAQEVLGSNWVAGFIFEIGLWKEMDYSLGLVQQRSAWIVLYMCPSFSGSNSRLDWQSSEETWSQTHQHVKSFFLSLLSISKCHLLQSNRFCFHICPVLCLLALFWTQEQAVWNTLVLDTISPITSSGLLRPPAMPFWLKKSQCLATVWCIKRTLCQPHLQDTTVGLILTLLASPSVQLCIFLLVVARADWQPQRHYVTSASETLCDFISFFTELYFCLFPDPFLSPSVNKWWEVMSAVAIPLGSLVPRICVMYVTHL